MSPAPEDKIFPPIPEKYKMPFAYASASFFWVFYQVNKSTLNGFLSETGLEAASFSDLPDDQGVVALNFQNYTDHLGMLVATVNEVEFNIHSSPIAYSADVPDISFDQYLYGQEQTKLIGSFRLHVPADNEIAVQAGRAAFGERKFLDKFCYNVPAINNEGHSDRCWDYIVADPHNLDNMPFLPSDWPADRPYMYRVTADLNGINTRPGNASPLTLYSMLPGGPDRPPGGPDQKLIGSRWNIFGIYTDFYPLSPQDKSKVNLDIGTIDHAMANDMRTIFGDNPDLIALRVFQSPPVAIENRAYYVPKS